MAVGTDNRKVIHAGNGGDSLQRQLLLMVHLQDSEAKPAKERSEVIATRLANTVRSLHCEATQPPTPASCDQLDLSLNPLDDALRYGLVGPDRWRDSQRDRRGALHQ